MNHRPPMTEPTQFLALLVYDDGNGRYSMDPHRIRATHPEIAYRIAIARGAEQRFGRTFIGLAALEESDDSDEAALSVSRGGDGHEHVVPKHQLTAFCDSRWSAVPVSDAEIIDALREPPVLVELPGLDAIPWHQLTHAYGTATDVPVDLRRVASSDPARRQEALWQLSGSIYHQGTLYPATAYAIPFLLRLASEPSLPERAEVVDLLRVIAESSVCDPEGIRRAWAWRKETFGDLYSSPCEELAELEIQSYRASRDALLAESESLHRLREDADPVVAETARRIAASLGVSARTRLA